MAARDADFSCRKCAAGGRRTRLRLHSHVQRQAYDRMVRVDRWYHDCDHCGTAAVFCTVRHWPLDQDAPAPTPPHDLHEWPTDVFTAVVVAPEEVPVSDPDKPGPYATPWPPPKTIVTATFWPRAPEADIPALTDEERADLVASRPGPELTARVLDALRAQVGKPSWPTGNPDEGRRP